MNTPIPSWEEQKQKMMDFAAHYDWKGLAQAFEKGNTDWHAEEWKELFDKIRKQERDQIVEEIKKIGLYYGNRIAKTSLGKTAEQIRDEILKQITSRNQE